MQNVDFILLLSKRLSGEISTEEATLLDAWISASPENADLVEQYKIAWNSSSRQEKVFQLDMEAEFRELQSRIQIAERPVARRVSMGRQIMRIAAALAFLLLAVWGFRQLLPTTPTLVVEQVNNQDKRLIKLPDGTRVWLREHAQLEYPRTFGASERRVKLSGEAYFEVNHQPERPFRVELSNDGLVEVLGTRFNIREATETTVLVRDGKVRYTPNSGENEAVLTKGDKAVFNKKTNKLHLAKVITFNELAWQTGGLEFVHTPLRDVIADLETYYQVKVELRNPALLGCLHTAPLTNQPIEEVLETLSITYQFKVSKPGPGHYILSNGRCQ